MVIAATSPARARVAAAEFARCVGGDAEVVTITGAGGVAERLNDGAAKTRGEGLIFCQDHSAPIAEDFGAVMRDALRTHDIVGAAGTTRLVSPAWITAGPPHVYGQWVTADGDDGPWRVHVLGGAPRVVPGVCALGGIVLGMRRAAHEKIRFDAARFPRALWDVDQTFSAHRAGMRLAVRSDLLMAYNPPDASARAWAQDEPAFLAKHGRAIARHTPRITRHTRVLCGTMAEVLEVMRPPHWDDAQPTEADR